MKKEYQIIKQPLKEKLVELSQGKLTEKQAEDISEQFVLSVDLDNEALKHKGIN